MKKFLMITTLSLVLGLMAGPAFAISFRFDYQQDGTPDPNGTEGLLLREQTVRFNIWLIEVEKPVSFVDFYVSWDPGALDIVDVTLVSAASWTDIFTDPVAPGVIFKGVADFSGPGGIPGPGVSGTEIYLQTIEIRGINIPQYYLDIKATLDDPIGDNDGVITNADETWYEKGEVGEAQGKIHTICREHFFECSEDDPCDRFRAEDICPAHVDPDDPAVLVENSYELIPDPDEITFCPGDTINVKHNHIATHEEEYDEVYDSMCDSECFNRYFEDYAQGSITECFYQCIEEDDTGYCNRLPDDCQTIHEDVIATSATYAYCTLHYDDEENTSHWIEHCGLPFEEGIEITVRPAHTPACGLDPILNDPPQLTGMGMGGIDIALPLVGLTPGAFYDICAEIGTESTPIDQIQIASSGCPTSNCTIQVPSNPFTVGLGGSPTMLVALDGDEGVYDISLEHSVDPPASLLTPSSPVTVTSAGGTIELNTADINLDLGQNYWANIKIIAEKPGGPSCETTFDYELAALSADVNCYWDDDISLGGKVYIGAVQLGLNPDGFYTAYVMKQPWTNLSEAVTEPTTFQVDGNGNMGCGTLIWANAQADSGSLPANFDIVIDVDNSETYNAGDVIDPFMICLSSDGDGICDDEDNCPNTPNTDQLDTFPPLGNDKGDACDCEGNFDGDEDVDGSEMTEFLLHFGRGKYDRPCANGTPCNGDFSCDGDVDGADVTKFLQDFGRGSYSNPCPVSGGVGWCTYPE